MNFTPDVIHWFAGLIVLAEALNKLERTDPCARGLSIHQRVVDGLKATAWLLLAAGAGGAVATPILGWLGINNLNFPLMRPGPPTFESTAVLLGFAVLIIRTRVKEG
ncbi:MAG: hypothetical protein B7Y56_02960 [Gallionellales bacterium 35-53-114]|jgi:hypothetical protein|nr:MAG: hypothetical protein B7Y56_02960 [Gallionellales bacterium 35-53-114]OYZ65067.1 MAG: hypothetical protein B7Y04_00120 [Gallionellales bacterium 24-53-125]OZB07976.1 MAG: hypothetical protein B7X61_10570 [Gallionellales bacterium 39-52-133]HQS59716.1 hypothetical protein [Gallionellaceae bacterium]HQS76470.1 hypothetical protein [Gallionellaceae bacterium]